MSEPFTFPALGGAGSRFQTRENLQSEVRRAIQAAVINPVDAAMVVPSVQTFTADGTSGPFTLDPPASATPAMTEVYVAGVRVPTSDYSIIGDDLTFVSGREPPNGAAVEVISATGFSVDVDISPPGFETASLASHMAEALTAARVTPDGAEVVSAPAVLFRRIITPDDFTGSDDQKIIKAMAALGSRGGTLRFLPRTYSCEGDVLVTQQGIKFEGTYSNLGGAGTRLLFSNAAHALRPRAQSFVLEGMRVEQGASTGSAVAFDGVVRVSYSSLEDFTILGGSRPLLFNNVLQIRLEKGRIIGTNPGEVVFMDGRGDQVTEGNSGVDAVEFCQVVIGGSGIADGVVMDGGVDSIKFSQCPILFTNRGVVTRQTGIATRKPGFIRFFDGGFENGMSHGWQIQSGRMIQIIGTYVSLDAEAAADAVRVEDADTSLILQGVQLRGASRDGIRMLAGHLTMNGCISGNNSRTSSNGAGVLLDGAAKAVITGNILGPFPTGGTTLQRHGVRILSNQAAPIVLANNDMRGNTISAIEGAAPAGSITTPNLT